MAPKAKGTWTMKRGYAAGKSTKSASGRLSKSNVSKAAPRPKKK